LPPPPTPTLSPYTTLFRSRTADDDPSQFFDQLDRRIDRSACCQQIIRHQYALSRLYRIFMDRQRIFAVFESIIDFDHFTGQFALDRKSTRLNSSHVKISYA